MSIRRNWLSWAAALLTLLALVGIGSAVNAAFASNAAGRTGDEGLTKDSLTTAGNGVIVGHSYKNDVSPPLRDMPQIPVKALDQPHEQFNLPTGTGTAHKDAPDTVVQRVFGALAMPAPILNFDGIPFPGVGCNCAPPDTDGEVGATQYVQMVNEGYQVFNKTTGASVLGPSSIVSVWTGFGGVCETNGHGDPVVLYDQLANRWLISQFAGRERPDRRVHRRLDHQRCHRHLQPLRLPPGHQLLRLSAPGRLARRLLHER